MDFTKILAKIKPDKKEEANLKAIVNVILNKIKIKDASVSLGGSGAKNTWLKGSSEIDIYVRFNYNKFKDNDKKISNLLKTALKKKFNNVSLLHGSRDYFQIKYKNYTVEAIPILDIKKSEEAKNITDVSKLHVDYVSKHRLNDDMRLAKAFAKANNVYGAESYISGFSGYILELLVIHYKGFKNLIKAASKWSSQTIIGNKEDVKNLNESKLGPLIFIDPVQKDRNAAAALSKEKYDKFIKICKELLKNPSEKFFELKEEKISKDALKIQFESLKGKKDIAGAKFVKALKFIEMQLNLEGYNVKNSGWKWDGKNGTYWFLLKEKKLKPLIKKSGPPIKFKDDFERFKSKHKKVLIEKGRSFSYIKRKYLTLNEFLKYLFKLPNVKDNIKYIKL
ncbi:nucleotidyltransferase domain-containing protein [Candidatus Woesearchaeota archaeon]|nr:nucleotidyltransferase domain-containing protein [Candidatus Woesearchaeota archaeon]